MIGDTQSSKRRSMVENYCLGCGQMTTHPSEVCDDCGDPIVSVQCIVCLSWFCLDDLIGNVCSDCCSDDEFDVYEGRR
jgi:hypothetical protein